jgi:lipoprotein-releasing system permease protein
MLALFIARRIRRTEGDKPVSRPAVLISMIGIAIGLAVMIISVAVVIGFKEEVRGKVIGFGSHIQISNFDAVRSYETVPVVVGDSLMQALRNDPEVTHVQRYSTKFGMIKTDDNFLGIVLKGLGPEFDPAFFRAHLVAGEIPLFSDTASSNRVVISQAIASKLKLKIGDRLFTYFTQDGVRVRRPTVVGIYQTNFSEYDNLFLLTDLHTVNRLNAWRGEQVSGAELTVKHYNQLDTTSYRLAEAVDHRTDAYGGIYFVRNIKQLTPQIFAWLSLLDANVWVILILVIGIAGFTMIAGLLIIIIERTNMIGTLKALGANDRTIREVFLWLSVFVIGRGMLWGNLIGVGFYLLQSNFGWLKLDPKIYYVETVPLSLNLWIFLLLNVGTLIVSLLMMLIPSFLITKINPTDSMRYE